MPIPIPSSLVEFILLGPEDDRRQLQDSPILGDVWLEFGKRPAEAVDLLIAPYKALHAGSVAVAIDDGLASDDNQANIAYLQGFVVACLTFQQLVRVVVPKTQWWTSKWHQTSQMHELQTYTAARLKNASGKILDSAQKWQKKTGAGNMQEIPALDRFATLAGLILWAGKHDGPEDLSTQTDKGVAYILENASEKEIVEQLSGLSQSMLGDKVREPLVWQVSLNRTAIPALTKSIAAVKGDAATTLFKVNCGQIGWGVIDSGIDGTHAAFGSDNDKPSRVKRSFDFKNFRRIVSLSNSKPAIRKNNIKMLLRDDLLNLPKEEEADHDLERLAVNARNRGPIHWELVEKFVEIKPGTQPPSNHGTHVAGIIGASKAAATKVCGESEDFADGMCPDITLYDFRVLAPDLRDTEFAIIAALQFIRYLNDRDNFFTIHGVNLSLSIPHDVRNFACGRTPICIESERMVESGVVVVAAAGNHGYKSFETKEGSFDSYAAFSITDPGNADSVITVGATHRFWPHTYGVSFFSSRGPTGDGRIKPDLVAPGERIRAPVYVKDSKDEWGDLDGTSMSAPHVSGAAAMLMARYSELIGQPRRIKKILCETATDLGRERSFQGHGMLDVLRAFQSI